MPDEVSGLILAGGLGQRMGREKARLAWGETTLLEHILETVRPLVRDIVIAVRDARPFRRVPARVVEDAVPGAHALGGLYTGLREASCDRCFVCACDAPFLNPALIRFLIARSDGWDVVIPRTSQGLQPLHAVYATSVLPVIEEQLRHRRWDLQALLPKLRSHIVGPGVLRRLDPEGRSFVNLNTPQEYEAARRMRCATTLTRVIDRRARQARIHPNTHVDTTETQNSTETQRGFNGCLCGSVALPLCFCGVIQGWDSSHDLLG